MRSGTSFFDWTVYKKTILRFWPLWAAYFVLWFIMLPLEGMMYLRMDANDLQQYSGYMKFFAEVMVGDTARTALPVAVIFGVLAAMAVFSHLYSARSANLFGSLPIRREGLFASHYLAGLSYLIVPNVVIFLLTLIVEMMGGCVNMRVLLFWLGVTCGECLLFYSIAVFCAMFTGHILALPAFYGILNVFVAGVVWLFYLVLNAFYYGFAGFNAWVYDATQWFTPAWKLINAVIFYREEPSYIRADGLKEVGIYTLVALVLTVCAFLLYRARRLESAGDVVSVRPMRPVFKYGVAFCVGMVFGVGTTTIIGGEEFTLMASILIWGVIGYFAAQMLLDKSFRVLKKWKGAVAVSGVFVVLFLVVGFDLTGFETRVPNAADVESVHVSGLSTINFADSGDIVRLDVDDPDQIELLTALHRAAVENRSDGWHDGDSLGCRLELDYTLNNGSTLRRSYYVDVDPRDVGQEGTAAWALEKLYHDPDLYWRVYGFDVLEEKLNQGGELNAQFVSYSEGRGGVGAVIGYGADARALLDAVEEDMRAGRIGVRTLVDGPTYYDYNPKDSLSFRVANPGNMGDIWYSLDIALEDTATSTIAELKWLEGNMNNDSIRNAFEAWLK